MSVFLEHPDAWRRACCSSHIEAEHEPACPFVDRARWCPSCGRWFDSYRQENSCYRCGTPLLTRADRQAIRDTRWNAMYTDIMAPDGPEEPF